MRRSAPHWLSEWLSRSFTQQSSNPALVASTSSTLDYWSNLKTEFSKDYLGSEPLFPLSN